MSFIINKFNTTLPEKAMENLFWLRNVAIIGQVTTLLFVKYVFQIPLVDTEMWGVVIFLVVFNLLISFRLQGDAPVTEWEIAAHLLIDTAAFAALLYYSGGSSNPFISFFLVSIALSAVFLRLPYSIFITLSCILFYTLLMVWFKPLPPMHERFGGDFNLHIMGMWISFILSAFILVIFVFLLVHIAREAEKDLAKVREENLINQHLVSLGTLSAGVAHEFGTPFSTINMIADELLSSPEDVDLVKEDALLLKEQTEACQLQLKKLFSNIDSGQSKTATQPLQTFLQNTIERWLAMRSEISLQSNIKLPEDISVASDETLSQTLINVLENAADASVENQHAEVSITAYIDKETLCVDIEDYGKGISVGESAQWQSGFSNAFSTTKDDGHGVGLVLSRATLFRLGGSLSLSLRDDKSGTLAAIRLPLDHLSIT